MTDDETHDTRSTGEKLTTGASRRDFLAATGAATATTLVGAGQAGADHSNPGDRVICYYPYWASGSYPASEIPFDTITALNWAFLVPEDDGTVTLGNSDPTDVRAVADHSDGATDLLFSISGGWYPEEYSNAAATEENRQRFATTAVDHVLEYGFDGIDFDWEYPNGRTHEDDPENFVELVRAVREELDSRVRPTAPLTIAASPAPGVADDAYLDGLFDHLDYVHVMNYNYHGSWSEYTNFNAPLYSGPDDPSGPDWNVSSHLEYWAGRPIANEDLVMGIPFYGRVFEGVVSNENDGLYQEFVDTLGAETYETIKNDYESDPDYEYFRHPDAKVPWLFDFKTKFVTYDDAHSVASKMDFVLNNGFGGAFCWELSQDPSDTLISVMHDKLH